MPKIEAGLSSDTFKLDGVDYTKGIYELCYQGSVLKSDNTTDYNKLEIGLINKYNSEDYIAEPKKITSWVNSSNVSYSDYTTLINDITTFII